MRRRRFFLILVVAAGFVASLAFAETPTRQETVLRVIDGDTFETTNRQRIRLIGVNSPEYEPWRNYSQPYGKEAAAFLKKILSGQRVTLESDLETLDKYGRTLAYVYLADGNFVNELLVREGYAKAKYYAPNGRYYLKLKNAQKQAKDEKKGLWAGKKSRSFLDNLLRTN